ncbi:MAG: ABC transporter permease, partial [Oscillospiraceae bacterium]|nr:ABC transporter permease [Oscillospiraceae bacterium]
MSFKDLFRFGGTNLLRRKTRTVLTALSMAVGVMCIVVLISVGLGYEQSYRESIESMGSLTKIDVMPSDSEYGRKAILNQKAVESFENLDGV